MARRDTFGGVKAIPLCGPISKLDPEGYLYVNPDVAGSPHQGTDAEFAAWHFEHYGLVESRIQLHTDRIADVMVSRRAKMEFLFDRSPASRQQLKPLTIECCGSDLELVATADARLPVPFERISTHGYDEPIANWVDQHPDDLFLDLGAGLTRDYRSNVLYTEIAALPTVDVLSFGDSLPFDDHTFDGIICLAVLEHVPDPLVVSAEMARVLRPGGRMIVDWPFLQPVHGYPHHYFNATEEGAREAFKRIGGMDIESFVPPHLHPMFTLQWFVGEWASRLTGSAREEFLALTMDDVMGLEPFAVAQMPWGRIENQTVISAGTRLLITKDG